MRECGGAQDSDNRLMGGTAALPPPAAFADVFAATGLRRPPDGISKPDFSDPGLAFWIRAFSICARRAELSMRRRRARQIRAATPSGRPHTCAAVRRRGARATRRRAADRHLRALFAQRGARGALVRRGGAVQDTPVLGGLPAARGSAPPPRAAAAAPGGAESEGQPAAIGRNEGGGRVSGAGH